MADPFVDDECRVLTSEAFDFVLSNELKRAMRSQTFLTLLVVEATAEEGADTSPHPGREIARLISREVRETDLMTTDRPGRLLLALLDADLQNSMRVVDRLVSRFEDHQFASPTSISVGAACCPTHGVDAATLQRTAESRRVPRRTSGPTSNAQ
jgi:GGDEF domain-containing protein